MGCFEDYMQFRDEVDEAKRKTRGNGASKKCRCKEDQIENDEDISKLKAKSEKR
jgi:hypothetical protein